MEHQDHHRPWPPKSVAFKQTPSYLVTDPHGEEKETLVRAPASHHTAVKPRAPPSNTYSQEEGKNIGQGKGQKTTNYKHTRKNCIMSFL